MLKDFILLTYDIIASKFFLSIALSCIYICDVFVNIAIKNKAMYK